MLEPIVPDALGEPFQQGDLAAQDAGDSQPAQPVADLRRVGAPDRVVPFPDAPDGFPPTQVIKLRLQARQTHCGRRRVDHGR